jgi:ATP-binding cassette, subfamily B (MDR/TAP), member 1
VVQEALEAASRFRTTVCIAHRLSTIKNADNIIVMSNGQIIERGSHDELYARDGMYRGLVNAQRISAQGTEDGVITPDEDIYETKNVIHHVRSLSGSSPSEFQTLFRRTTTGQTTSVVELKHSASGVVAKRKYSLLFLFRKVPSLLKSLNSDRRFLSTNKSGCLWWLGGYARLSLAEFTLRWRFYSLTAYPLFSYKIRLKCARAQI